MTRSAGTRGLTRPGSPPRSAIASRMTARSTTAGTPVKSWSRTRAGTNGTSASAATPGRHEARVSTSAAWTMPPPAWRSTFSSRIFSVTGGIHLDPASAADHGTHPHSHPHVQSSPGEPPVIGIVGAGAVGTALGVALDRAGWRIHAVASRDRQRRERFQGLVPGVRAFDDPTPLVEEVELIVLAVPDDAIASVAGSLHMYSGQAMIHTSGLVGAESLASAMAAGTQVGSFHPLVAFADLERAVAALHGAMIAIEGDEQLLELLARMAEVLGANPVRLAPGAKPAYHAAAVLAAGGFDALLDAIAALGRVAGLDEAGSLAIYGRLIEQ